MSSMIVIDLMVQSQRLKQLLEQILGSFPDVVLKRSKGHGAPHIIVFELESAAPARSFEQLRSLRRASPHTDLFVTADVMEPSILLEALRAGVHEFLPQPIVRQHLERAIESYKARAKEASAQQSEKGCKVISVIGGKSGVGTTLACVNLAGFLHQLDDGKSIALVDLNFQDPDLPLFLDLEPVHSLQDISDNLDRLDGTFLMNVLSRHGSGLYVLPLAPRESLSSKTPVSSECIQKTLDLMRSLFDYVVVDCGHVLDVPRRSVLASSSSIVLMSTLHVPAIRSTKEVLDLLREAGHASERVKLVMNRFEPSDDGLLKNTGDALNHPVSVLIPNNSQAASSAINNGQLLAAMNGRSDIGQSLERLAESFAERRNHSKSASLIGNYFKTVRAKFAGEQLDLAGAPKHPIMQMK